MKTIHVDVWDVGTGECDMVRSWTVDETNPAAIAKARVEAQHLINSLANNDHSTDHVPIVTED